VSKIVITDYFSAPGPPETRILGNLVGVEATEETEVLIVWHDIIDEDYIKDMPHLKGVQRYGVGFDNLDIDYLKSRGIVCCNNPDYGVDEVSDTALSMILNFTRGTTSYNERAKCLYNTWQENVIPTVRRHSEMTLGIIGAGRIGGSLIQKAKALKFNIVFYDKYQPSGIEKLHGVQRMESLEDLLSTSDIVSVHVPSNDETRGMINKEFIECMKDDSILVNTARGDLIESLDVLYDGLKSKKISKIALDVLPEEPPITSPLINDWRSSLGWIRDRLIINPHTAYYSVEAIEEMRVKAATNALRILKGRTPLNIV